MAVTIRYPQAMRNIVFEKICKVRNPKEPPTRSWFAKWWKAKGIPETKAIGTTTAQDKEEVDVTGGPLSETTAAHDVRPQ